MDRPGFSELPVTQRISESPVTQRISELPVTQRISELPVTQRISELPLELQFELLLDLPLRDILAYCRTSTDAATLCDNHQFWNAKARREFGLNLDRILPNNSYLDRFRAVDRVRDNPAALAAFLISQGVMDTVPELLDRARAFVIPLGRSETLNEDLSAALLAAVESGDADLLERLLALVSERTAGRIGQSARRASLRAIEMQRSDLFGLLRPYWNPQLDPMLNYIYARAIENGIFPVFQYLDQFIQSHRGFELRAAINSRRPDVIRYFFDRNRDLLSNPSVVNQILLDAIDYDNLLGVQALVGYAPNLIDLDLAFDQARMQKRSAIEGYLRSLTDVPFRDVYPGLLNSSVQIRVDSRVQAGVPPGHTRITIITNDGKQLYTIAQMDAYGRVHPPLYEQ